MIIFHQNLDFPEIAGDFPEPQLPFGGPEKTRVFQSLGLRSCLGIHDFLWQVLWWKQQDHPETNRKGFDELTSATLIEKNMGCLDG